MGGGGQCGTKDCQGSKLCLISSARNLNLSVANRPLRCRTAAFAVLVTKNLKVFLHFRKPVRTMSDTLRPPSLQVSVPKDAPSYSDGGRNAVSDGSMRSSSSTPTLRRKRFKMRRMRNVPSEREIEKGRLTVGHLKGRSGSKEYLQLPSIEITPSSDEDALSTWSSCSTPSASPRRKRFLLRKWLKVRQKKEQGSESRLVWALPTHPSPQSPLLPTCHLKHPCCFKALCYMH